MRDELKRFRKHLDEIDASLLDLMARRLEIACKVAQNKQTHGARLRDRQREAELLARLRERARESGLPEDSVLRIFQELLNASFYEQIATVSGTRRSAHAVRVGYQGVPGAYSEWAAQRLLTARRKLAHPNGYRTFAEVAQAVADGHDGYGVLPVENTLAGPIHETYDLIKRYSLCIVGEDALSIEHCLGAIRPMPLHEIRRVYSHPQALAQCSSFLARLPSVEVCPYFDTASSMQKVAAEQDPAAAAIGSENAAQRYGLTVIERDIANYPENHTRFLLISTQHEPVPKNAASKTTLLFAVPHREGALHEALKVVHDHQVNMTRIESRPRPGEPWQYDFYLDFEGNRADTRIQAMLAALSAATTSLRVLGCYVSRTVSEGRPVSPEEIAASTRPRRQRVKRTRPA